MPRVRSDLPKALTRKRKPVRIYASAREASLANLEIARARHRPWRPWRSPQESWVIRHLTWQWFIYRGAKWSARTLARCLGVYHRHVQKLIEKFVSNPPKMWQEARESGFEMATFDQLHEARQITRGMAARGSLRPLRHTKYGERKPAFQHRLAWPFRIPKQIPIWAMPVYSMSVAALSHMPRS